MAGPVANYSAGNAVYNGGSPQATQGTVDPTGYIDRSLNNPSQSRSGLAQAAIQRLQAPTGALGPGPQEAPPATAASYGAQPSQSVLGSNSPADQNIAMQQQAAANLPIPKVAPLNVNAIGQISLPASQSLPLDADLAAQEAAQTSAANNQLTQYQNQQQALASNYALAAHQAQDKMPGVLNTLLANYGSGRGLGFSSGYGSAYNNDQDTFQQQLDSLYGTAQQGLAGVQTNAALVPTLLSQAIQQILATQASRNNTTLQGGGTLGLSNGLNPILNAIGHGVG